MSSRIESLTIQEDVKEAEAEAEDEEGLPIYPYERLKVNSSDPATKIDVTKQGVKYEQLMIFYFLSFLYCFFPEIVLFNCV